MVDPNTKPQRVALYARVSSDEQAEANTIQNQVNFAERFADLNQLEIAATYLDEGVSGTIPLHERPQGKCLLADAKAGKFAAVLVYRVDRLARRLKVLLDGHEALQAAGVGVRSMTEPIDSTTPIGRFIFQLLGSIAELERETIVERSILGSNRKAAEGKWLGGIVPYGYRRDEQGSLAISEERLPGFDLSEADVVRKCYRLLLLGWSTYRIADHLNALGIPPSYAKDGRQALIGKRKQNTSGQWTPGRIRNMLAQTIYMGVHEYGKRTQRKRETIIRHYPPIIAEETWRLAQEQMTANQRWLSPQNAKRTYLLRSLIKCGLCGLTYVGSGNSKREKPYYKCTGKVSYRGKLNGRCPSKAVLAEDLESNVWQDIVQFAHDPGPVLAKLAEQLRAANGDRQTIESELNAATQALQKKHKEREIILSLLRKETITYQEGENELKKIADEAEGLKEQQERLFAQLQQNIDVEKAMIEAEALLRSLREKIEGADSAKKREILEALVREIVVETIGEGRNSQAKIRIRYAFDTVACKDMGSWLQRAQT
ncbi:MAG: recombinase family protein [Chloroflexi bacterium]|nr:recombinase family protein [Chloroflexota bacterium]